MSAAAYRDKIVGDPGYVIGLSFTPEELKQVVSLIEDHWLSHLESVVPDKLGDFKAVGIGRYHELAHLVDHGTLWPRTARILPKAAAEKIRRMSPFQKIQEEFGDFHIMDDLKNGWEEFCWRLVRPGQKGDVGPLHADTWFHQVSDVKLPENKETVKGWTAICVETGVSGLKVIPSSHHQDWPFTAEMRHGMMKPQIQVDESTLPVEIFKSTPGDMILFHEKLLHGGIPHDGKKTRVSLEYTLIVDKL